MADPFCIARNDFEPTRSWFPDLLVDADGRPIRTVGMEGNREGNRQKWVWSQDELNDLDLAAQQGIDRSRGTIPLYKLFVLTWVRMSFRTEREPILTRSENSVGYQNGRGVLACPGRLFLESTGLRMDDLVCQVADGRGRLY